MRRVFVLFICCVAVFKAEGQDSISKLPSFSFQLDLGFAYNPQFVKGSAYGYDLQNGKDLGISFGSYLGRNTEFLVRLRSSIYGKFEEDILADFKRQRPELTFITQMGRPVVSQLNIGLARKVFLRKWSLELQQYLGVSVLKIPKMKVSGWKGREEHALFIRETQRNPMLSFYTALAIHYQLKGNTYLSFKPEFAAHYDWYMKVENTAFGLYGYNAGANGWNILFSAQLGIGWNIFK